MTATPTLAGRPVTGDITHYSSRNKSEQWSAEKLLELLDAVFADGAVEAVRWRQYTPYFNDGDACTFGTGEIYIKLAGGDDEGGDYGDGFHDSLKDWPAGYFDTHSWSRNDDKPRVDYDDKVLRDGITEATATAYSELEQAFHHFEDVLHETFGDPAEVTATREGFHVEHYEHD
jgi:hypothetical protein